MPQSRSLQVSVALVLAAIAVFLIRGRQGTYVHQEFGPVSQASTGEYPGLGQKIRQYLRRIAGIPTAASTLTISVATAPLQWSAGGGVKHGYIYCSHPTLNETAYWEFALSTNTRLSDVRRGDLPSKYYGMNDPGGAAMFGTNWLGHAIRVPEGQIFFARLVSNRADAYIIRLAEQMAGRRTEWMRAEYVRVSP